MSEDMWVVVVVPEGPDAGMVYLARELEPDEPMDERAFADRTAAMLGEEIDSGVGFVPASLGDLRVEFRRGSRSDRAPKYGGESYYFKEEDY